MDVIKTYRYGCYFTIVGLFPYRYGKITFIPVGKSSKVVVNTYGKITSNNVGKTIPQTTHDWEW